MNAETKVKAKAENPNLRIWNAVCKTDPAHTKRVNQRGGFTAIDAQYQIMEATRQFGPVGEGWGYDVGEFQIVGPLIVVPVTLWHGSRDHKFGPILGCAEMVGQRPDRDAPKKAVTDAITKGLSQLGFNADVFLGKFDDNKYLEDLKKEFAGPPADTNGGNGKDAPFPPGPAKNKTELKAMCRDLWRDVEGSGDTDELEILLASKETVALVAQMMKALPHWWDGGTDARGETFEGLEAVIARRRKDFEQLETVGGGDWRSNPINGG
jgi:hypothetical protein